MEHKVFDKNKVIYSEGDRSSDMYFIRAGSGRVELVTNKFGVDAELRCGDFFGELGFLGLAKRRVSTAIARTVCYTTIIKRNDFIDALCALPVDATKIRRAVPKYLRNKNLLNEVFLSPKHPNIVSIEAWDLFHKESPFKKRVQDTDVVTKSVQKAFSDRHSVAIQQKKVEAARTSRMHERTYSVFSNVSVGDLSVVCPSET